MILNSRFNVLPVDTLASWSFFFFTKCMSLNLPNHHLDVFFLYLCIWGKNRANLPVNWKQALIRLVAAGVNQSVPCSDSRRRNKKAPPTCVGSLLTLYKVLRTQISTQWKQNHNILLEIGFFLSGLVNVWCLAYFSPLKGWMIELMLWAFSPPYK